VSVGISNDTAQFVVNSIRCWLDTMGRGRYPDMNQLMIRADGGGSNGSRVRLFKLELQRLAQETGLTIKVCQLSAGDIEVEQNRCVTNTSSKEGDVELYERWG
jgi:Rhodopirellula transposase DDE domain